MKRVIIASYSSNEKVAEKRRRKKRKLTQNCAEIVGIEECRKITPNTQFIGEYDHFLFLNFEVSLNLIAEL